MKVRWLCLGLVVLTMLSKPAIGEQVTGWKVVNYWSITCAPCRIEIPELNILDDELAEQNVQLVGINFDDDDRTTTLQLAKRMGIKFPTLTRAEVEALGLAAPNVLPTTYLVSPEKNIAARLVGVQTRESIQAQVDELVPNEERP